MKKSQQSWGAEWWDLNVPPRSPWGRTSYQTYGSNRMPHPRFLDGTGHAMPDEGRDKKEAKTKIPRYLLLVHLGCSFELGCKGSFNIHKQTFTYKQNKNTLYTMGRKGINKLRQKNKYMYLIWITTSNYNDVICFTNIFIIIFR